MHMLKSPNLFGFAYESCQRKFGRVKEVLETKSCYDYFESKVGRLNKNVLSSVILK